MLGAPILQFAAFFRNTNLGRPGSPSRNQFEASFAEAGALRPVSFQSNGTLLFEAASQRKALSILGAASTKLQVACGLVEPGCVRSVALLASLPVEQVFQGIDRSSVHELSISFACRPLLEAPSLPLFNERKDAEVLWLEDGNALGIARKVMSGPGSPNRLLEHATGVPFTSRSILTLQRLLGRRALHLPKEGS